ncbi:LuxR C-terminal-related transcriptional regulator [Desulfosediminicola sp.]|uniref:LuxR C-terminal-related transcriptional regulator n=1 Tax=Desulfosediminicola sp. TaxID=2886825 RepID=UPI003AF291A9
MQQNITTRQPFWDLLRQLPSEEESYLERWSLRMQQAGYLSLTTAKRDDCMNALDCFIKPMQSHYQLGVTSPDFAWLIQNHDQWAQPQIETARNHQGRGVTWDMYLGCFKTFLHSLFDVIDLLKAGEDEKHGARNHIRLYGDALEVLFVKDWVQRQPEAASHQLDQVNRLLTLEKCRFENILNTTSDLIFVIDSHGIVSNINTAVQQVLPNNEVLNAPIWESLPIEGRTMDEILKYYPVTTAFEVAPFDDGNIYRMQLSPISNVSLASDEYLLLLSNITPQALQRETLERIVSERTEDLLTKTSQLEEMNITLRNILKSIDKEQEGIIDDISSKISTFVLPVLDRIDAEPDSSIRKGYVTIIRDQLDRLVHGSKLANPVLLKLTFMETRICQFIQAGHSSKDIADNLNLSLETIQTHRKNIRRKLGLHGKNVSLYAHLKTIGLTF